MAGGKAGRPKNETVSIADAIKKFGYSRTTWSNWVRRGLLGRPDRQGTRCFVNLAKAEGLAKAEERRVSRRRGLKGFATISESHTKKHKQSKRS